MAKTLQPVRPSPLQRLAGCCVVVACLLGTSDTVMAQPLALARSIALPAVHGRIDHMSIDVERGRLYVAALGSDSVEVIDLKAGKRIDRITSLHEPQGVLFVAHSGRLLVANGSGGGVQAFADGKAPAVASQASLDDADNLRLDPRTGQVYVGYGKALAALDPDSLQILRSTALTGHPESFQIEASGRRIYVNVPDAGQIAVVDRASGKVAATWRLDGAARNFAMALDERRQRVFIVTRSPARLIGFDTESGRQIGEVPVCGDADDLFIDDAKDRIYVVCGDGRVSVARRVDGQMVVDQNVVTAPGARTGLFVPQLSTLFVAVPARGGSTAEVRAYGVR